MLNGLSGKQRTGMAKTAARTLGLLMALGLGSACVITGLFTAHPPLRWRLIAQPPVPAGAVQLELMYPSNDVERNLNFEIEQSAAMLQQFYRRDLPNQGWRYRCTLPADLPCGRLAIVSPEVELIEVYELAGAPAGQGPTLEIIIGRQGTWTTTSSARFVRISECCLQQYPKNQSDWYRAAEDPGAAYGSASLPEPRLVELFHKPLSLERGQGPVDLGLELE